MKVPPKKPHFFKPVLAGFKNGLKIPIGFLKYVKKQDQYEHATLRRAGKRWLVKVNGRRLEEGNWKVFVEEHDLQLGDLLVFRHEGDMEFEVSIFDSSHCNREYAEYLREEDEEKEEEDEDEEENGEEEDEEEDKEENEEEEDEEEDEDEDEAFGQSHFVCIIRQYCLSRGYISLPQKFALANGLTNKKCWLIVRDERQRSWKLKLSSSNSTRARACIGDGWRKFAAQNNLKEGDCIIFEIVTNGETPIWKFRVVTNGETPMRKFQDILKKSSKMSALNAQVSASTSSDDDHEEEEEEEDMEEDDEEDMEEDDEENEEEDEEDMEEEDEEEKDEENMEEDDEENEEEDDEEEEDMEEEDEEEEDEEDMEEDDEENEEEDMEEEDEEEKDEKDMEEDDEENEEEDDEEEEDKEDHEDNKEEDGEEGAFGQSHFDCIIRQYCLSRGFIFLPQQFALANGLTNKKCWLIVRDERQRSWNLKLSSSNTRTRAYIGDGWRKFTTENCIKEGDRIMFEMVTNGETPIWKFRVVMRKFREKRSLNINLSNKNSSHAEAAINKPFVQSHFECTIREYSLSRGFLYLPKQFAFANGLNDKKCDLIIRDERQRSWNLKLRYSRTEVFIGDGWRKFVVDNCLKKRDRAMFEVVTNGETPMWKFQVVTNEETPLVHKSQDIMKKSSNMRLLNAQVSTSTSGDDGHPYFVSTIKPYCIGKSVLYLPMDFAKSNGLMNRKCKMILKDEAQRCWSVGLGRDSHHFGIINGWAKFRTENGLQVGDAYKFELIKNGEIPIAQFHCKLSGKVAKRKEH